jgi:hypothetical protein
MKESIAVWVVFGGFTVTIFSANAEVYGSAVAGGCTAHIGQIVCADLQIAAPGLPTTRGTSFD